MTIAGINKSLGGKVTIFNYPEELIYTGKHKLASGKYRVDSLHIIEDLSEIVVGTSVLNDCAKDSELEETEFKEYKYKIVKATDHSGNDNTRYSHRINRIVAAPEIQIFGNCLMRYLVEADGKEMDRKTALSTSTVKNITIYKNDGKCCLEIRTRNSIIYLEEVA